MSTTQEHGTKHVVSVIGNIGHASDASHWDSPACTISPLLIILPWDSSSSSSSRPI